MTTNRRTSRLVQVSIRSGFTLVEMLLATALALILLVSVIQIFLMMNNGFAESRVLLDLLGRVRNAQLTLQSDLSHYTTVMMPPRSAWMEDGYFSCGKLSNVTSIGLQAEGGGFYQKGGPANAASGANRVFLDSRMIDPEQDYHYIAMTVCNKDAPFHFTEAAQTHDTPYAEVVWFVYQNDLYRVVVPIVPQKNDSATVAGAAAAGIPAFRQVNLGLLGHRSHRITEQLSTVLAGTTLQNYLVLPNVVSFRVDVWDPKTRSYVSMSSINSSQYYNIQTSSIPNASALAGGGYVYDTWSTLMMNGKTNVNGVAANNNGNLPAGLADRMEAFNGAVYTDASIRPPSQAFLPGIRVTVRAFDADTGQMREFRVAQDFRRW